MSCSMRHPRCTVLSLSVHVLCESCRYDLFGRDVHSVCPECRHPVMASLRPERVLFARRAALRCLHIGLAIMLGAVVAQLICMTVPIVWVIDWGMVAGAIVLVAMVAAVCTAAGAVALDRRAGYRIAVGAMALAAIAAGGMRLQSVLGDPALRFAAPRLLMTYPFLYLSINAYGAAGYFCLLAGIAARLRRTGVACVSALVAILGAAAVVPWPVAPPLRIGGPADLLRTPVGFLGYAELATYGGLCLAVVVLVTLLRDVHDQMRQQLELAG